MDVFNAVGCTFTFGALSLCWEQFKSKKRNWKRARSSHTLNKGIIFFYIHTSSPLEWGQKQELLYQSRRPLTDEARLIVVVGAKIRWDFVKGEEE